MNYDGIFKRKRGMLLWAYNNPPGDGNNPGDGGGGTDPGSGGGEPNPPGEGAPGDGNTPPADDKGTGGTGDNSDSGDSDDSLNIKYGDDTPIDKFLEAYPQFKDNGSIKRYKNVGELLKGFTELDSKMGNMIALPGEDASDEEKNAAMDKIFQKLGKPESADKYELSSDVPDGLQFNEELQKDFKQFAHENNFTAAQAAAAQKFWNDKMGTTLEEHQRNQRIAEETNAQTQAKELKGMWGSEYKTRTQIAINTAKSLLSQDMLDYLDETGLGNNAKFIRDMYNISKKFSGDGPPKGPGGGGGGEDYDSLTSEAMSIKKEKDWHLDPVKKKRVQEIDTKRAELRFEKPKQQ